MCDFLCWRALDWLKENGLFLVVISVVAVVDECWWKRAWKKELMKVFWSLSEMPMAAAAMLSDVE